MDRFECGDVYTKFSTKMCWKWLYSKMIRRFWKGMLRIVFRVTFRSVSHFGYFCRQVFRCLFIWHLLCLPKKLLSEHFELITVHNERVILFYVSSCYNFEFVTSLCKPCGLFCVWHYPCFMCWHRHWIGDQNTTRVSEYRVAAYTIISLKWHHI